MGAIRRRSAVVGMSALAALLLFGNVASGQTINKCQARKKVCVIKKIRSLLACHTRAEGAGTAVDPACLARAATRFSDPVRGCIAKLEANGGCLTTGDATALENKIDAFVLDVVQELDPVYPAPTLNKCSAGKKRCVSDKAVGILRCHVTAETKGVLDPACIQKRKDKFDGGAIPSRACFAKLEVKGGCLTTGDTAALEAKIDAFIDDVVCELDPASGTCPGCGDNSVNQPSEQCDGTDDAACPGLCRPPGDLNECRCPVCGDNSLNQPSEQCDGSEDAVCPGLCRPPGDQNECRCPACGDNSLNQPSEQCDGIDAAACPDRCLPDCTCAVCGNGLAEVPAEDCDGVADATCPGLCLPPGDPNECRCPRCGDGAVNQASEACDGHDDAACPGLCTLACACAVCGNNLAEPPVETCDGTDDAACPGLCRPPGDPDECVCPCSAKQLASKIKCVIKKKSCLFGCYAKSAHGGGPVDPLCTAKCRAKFDGGSGGPAKSCFGKIHCVKGDLADIERKIDTFVLDVVEELDPPPLNDPRRCREGKLKCILKYDACVLGLEAKAANAGGVVDGTSLAKCKATVTSCFAKLEAKGGCDTIDDLLAIRSKDDGFINGLICELFRGRHDIHTHRCTGDTRVKCNSNGDCAGPGGTCEYYFGTNLPLAAGGVTTCITTQFVGPITGTFNQQTGASSGTAAAITKVYNGITISAPCPRCVGDVCPNDGVSGGTCNGGSHNGQTCDANGSTTFAAYGATSLDCPPSPAGLIGTLPIDLANTNDGASVLAVGPTSPSCNGAPGERCACASCSLNASIPCKNDAQCAAAAAGTCTNTAGEPRKPNACLDDSNSPGDGSVCVDAGPVGDGEGECPEGVDQSSCAIESFRGCSSNADCPTASDFCRTFNRRCFPGSGNLTYDIVADGTHTTPVNHWSHATFGTTFCIAPTSSSAVNSVAGLPGPGRLELGGSAAENGNNAACPTAADFTATSTGGVLDIGWTGIAHDARVVSDVKVSVSVTGCANPAPNCGECTYVGPILNPNAVP